ncbi:MAG: hypothetical protein H6867_05580 [Rhodospirillales bacterium]|nr:hypothetical protein [Rhodospirillales bacterium]MCB9995000.1 hypothetical protein [Rhodospirillales bacterium]
MTYSFRILCLILLFLPAASLPAKAQVCDTLFEVITTLRPPTFGFPTVWDAKFGKRESMVQMASGVAMDGGTVFTISRTLSKKDFRPEKIVLAEINRRGRALKEESYPAKTAEEPIKMIRVGDQFVALSNVRGGKGNAQKWVRLSWYDLNGKYKREHILKDGTFDYSGATLVPSAEKSGFIAVIHAVSRADETDQNGLLIRMSPSGSQLWRRAYRPGIPNKLTGLTKIDETSYIATGRIRLDDGRMAGWAMKLAYDGAVQWQRTYPRGRFSVFTGAALSPSQSAEGYGFYLSGQSTPTDDGPDAAWIMEISALGEPLWQRYYRRNDYTLSGQWVQSEADGRIILMMNAQAVDGQGGHDHIRILTLSPRGILINDESYYEGLLAKATDFVPGWNGERIFTATIADDAASYEEEDVPITVIGLVPDEENEGEEKVPEDPVHKGWVMVATALDPYEDPCKGRYGP